MSLLLCLLLLLLLWLDLLCIRNIYIIGAPGRFFLCVQGFALVTMRLDLQTAHADAGQIGIFKWIQWTFIYALFMHSYGVWTPSPPG